MKFVDLCIQQNYMYFVEQKALTIPIEKILRDQIQTKVIKNVNSHNDHNREDQICN